MSRPKGSKNKSTIAKLASLGLSDIHAETIAIEPSLTVAQPEISADDIEADAEYNAMLAKQDDTLDAFLVECDATFSIVSATDEILPDESKAMDFSLLNLMTKVHGEIASKINAVRQALSSDGKLDFIRDNPKEDYATLMPSL